MPPIIAGPAAEVLLYDYGAEGYPIEAGFDLYDIPGRRLLVQQDGDSGYGKSKKSWSYEPSYRTVLGSPGDKEPSIMVVPEINTIIPSPRFIEYDTLTTAFNFFGGDWENIRTLRPPRAKRLIQRTARADTVWRSESQSFLPDDPLLTFTFQRLDQHHATDINSYPGYAQVVISDRWAFRFSESWTAGIWVKVGEEWLQARRNSISGRGQEVRVTMAVVRGCLCVNYGGQKWEVLKGVDPVIIPDGQLVVEGAGAQVAFGLHQTVMDNCSFETFDLPILEEHFSTPLATVSGYEPLGTSFDIYDIASPPATFRYKVVLRPDPIPVAGFPFDFYRFPELYAVLWQWPTTLHVPVGSSVSLTAGPSALTEIDLTEQAEISQRSGRLTVLWDPTTAFSGVYGERLVSIQLGYYYNDGTFVFQPRCLMYVKQPETQNREEDWDSEVSLDLADLYTRAVNTIVDEGWMPLDGLSCIEARNYILLKMGLPLSRGTWLNTGAFLPAGPPDNPKWWPKAGTKVDDLFKAIDLWENTETFVAADGQWASRVKFYVDTLTSFIYDGNPADKTLRIKDIRYPADHREVRTAVLVQSKDDRDGSFWATAINYNLERNPATDGFIGYRRWDRYDDQPVITLAQAILVANQRLAQIRDVPQRPELTVPGNHLIYRGTKIQVANVAQGGFTGFEEFRVEALSHKWRPTLSDTETEISSRRVA